jgi:hypothetical protein
MENNGDCGKTMKTMGTVLENNGDGSHCQDLLTAVLLIPVILKYIQNRHNLYFPSSVQVIYQQEPSPLFRRNWSHLRCEWPGLGF